MRKEGRRSALWVLAALTTGPLGLLAVAAHTGWVEYDSRRPPRRAVERPALVEELAALRDVALRTRDGLTLRGWYVPGHNGAAVVLAHGYGASRMEMLPDARLLAARGYGVLLLDLRAHGESEGEVSTFGDSERRDLEAAVAYVASQPGVARVGMLGVSIAAPPTALVAAADARVGALVLRSAVTSMRSAAHDEWQHLRWLRTPAAVLTLKLLGIDVDAVDAHDAVRRYAPRPLLLLHGRRDEVVPLARAEALLAAAEGPAELVIFDEAGHDGLRESDPERYDRALTGFFDRTLLSVQE